MLIRSGGVNAPMSIGSLVICAIIGLLFYASYYDVPIESSFNSKTAYRHSDLIELEAAAVGLERCSLVHSNTVLRHGTRYPSRKEIDGMETLFNRVFNRSESRRNLPPEFLSWTMPFLRDREKQLTAVGRQELREIGQRFADRFTSAGLVPLRPGQVRAVSSSISRSKISGSEFLSAFSERLGWTENINGTMTEDDQYLRYFDHCKKYLNVLRKKNKVKTELKKFLKGPEMTNIIKDIHSKYGLNDVSIDAEDIRLVYKMCGFEVATNESSLLQLNQRSFSDGSNYGVSNNSQLHLKSALCSILDKSYFPVLEYSYDLNHYWEKAYGDPIMGLMSCKLLSVIIKQIREAVDGHLSSIKSPDMDYIRAVFWFSHAETILPVIAQLKLFYPSVPMHSDTLNERIQTIKDFNERFSVFRTANIVPFAGNFGFDVYHCPTNSDDGSTNYRVQMKLNEKVIPWPGSNQPNHISLSEFEKRLNQCLPEKFNFEEVCNE